MQNINFLLVGVGGQGVLTASNILATAGMLAGYDVKKSEIHGMSQRGGNVSSHIRWGETVFSPIIGNGETDSAIATRGLSRWHNYYVEGLAWLMKHTGIDGLYLDGIGYDREVIKRVVRVMRACTKSPRINFHCGNSFDFTPVQRVPNYQSGSSIWRVIQKSQICRVW